MVRSLSWFLSARLPLQGIVVASEKRPPAWGQTQRWPASPLWVVFTPVISWYQGPVGNHTQGAGDAFASGGGGSRLSATFLTDPFLLSHLRLPGVRVLRLRKIIQENLREVELWQGEQQRSCDRPVLPQSCGQQACKDVTCRDRVGLSFGTMAALQEGWEMQRLGVFAT